MKPKLSTPRKVVPTEHEEQSKLFAWLKANHPAMEKATFAVPNGMWMGNLSPKQRAMLMNKLKREGLKTGVPDVVSLYPVGKFYGLVIEMKRQGYVPSDVKPEQHAWLDGLLELGYATAICGGADSAKTAVKTYLLSGEGE